jgi:hypothetical protein
MKLIKFILSLIIVCVLLIVCQQIIQDSISNQKNKNDYAELNHIKYGIFSVDEWKRQIMVIVDEGINKLYLSRTNEQALRTHIEALLYTLIDQVDQKLREANKGSAKGWVKQSLTGVLVNMKDIKRGIPDYAETIMREMTTTETKGQLKTVLNEKLKEYFDETFDTQDKTQLRRILHATHSRDLASARIKLSNEIAEKHDRIYEEAALLIVLSVILFALSGFSKQPLAPSRYLLLMLCLAVLLVAGVTTPMIDLEAKISKLSFVLMGHPVNFENQVLYFQSKSILDVFWIMIRHADIQMKFVGVLLVTFSVLFPILKIISSLLYYYNYFKARQNPVVSFFVLKSGKWSMADVMVVAMFMAYIGFNGIITNQFGQLNQAGPDMVILTTNGTTLQPGYYLFLTYTVLALFLSGFLTRKPKPYERQNS